MFIQVHYPEEEGIPSKYRGDFTNVKSVKCDISNFSESHQDYESADFILISESWIFANFVT